MHKPQISIIKILTYGSLSIVILCIVLFITYRIVQMNDRSSCYGKFASQFNVSPTYIAVGDEFLKQIDRDISAGMKKEEVMNSINKIAPVSEAHGGFGGNRIEARLEICKITENDLYYLISFEDDKFVGIELYSSD